LIVYVGILALNTLKENKYIGRGTYPGNVIAVNGKGEVKAVPDVATFSFSVTEEAKTVADAQDKEAKKMNQIIPALKAMGIEEKDIKTEGYNTYPKYDYSTTICPMSSSEISYPCRTGKQTLTGYEVSQTVTVKIRNTEKSGEALTKVGSLGATNISGIQFVVDDMEKIQREARDKAIEDAKLQAKELSEKLGVKLVKVVNFYEGGNSPMYYAMDSKMGMGMGAESASVAPALPVGENQYVSNVTITYEVE
jgi:uncharacterized protein YggE